MRQKPHEQQPSRQQAGVAKRTRIALALAVAGWLAVVGPASADQSFITVGTGGATSLFYQAGGGLCSLVNARDSDDTIRCTVAGSSGSQANIRALRQGSRAFGFAQADLVKQAYAGNIAFADQDHFDGLRTVLALPPQSLTIIARDGSDIDSAQDLSDERINLGPTGSGPASVMQALMDGLGWTPADFKATRRLAGTDQVSAFCDGELDAAVFITAAPDNHVQQALDCNGSLVPIEGPAIDSLTHGAPYYTETTIPADAYSDVSNDVPTFGVTSFLISSTDTSQRLVHALTQAVLENVDQFDQWHDALEGLQPSDMADGMDRVEVPMHPGAEKYLNEQDLM